jgi:hypothetical protein
MVGEKQQSSSDVLYFTNTTSLEPITLRKTEAYSFIARGAWGMGYETTAHNQERSE